MIGTIVPGSSIVFAAGVLAGLHALDPWLAAALSIAGAIVGDAISFELGHRYQGTIRSLWPMRTHPALFAHGEAYFAANGRKSVFLGRFLGPLRAIVPLIAGMSSMRRADFYAIDVMAAFTWATAHLLPGVLFGASLQLAGAVSSRLVALVAIVVAGLWLIAKATRVVTQRAWPCVKRLRERLFVRASGSGHPLARAVLPLLDPARREPMTLLVSAVLLVAGGWLFLGVVEDVVTKDVLIDVDRAVYRFLQALRSRWGDDVMVTITEFAGAQSMIAVIAAVALWFAVTRRFHTLGYWLAAAGFAQVLVWALKYALGRARPETAYARIDEFSLPSGHAAMSMVVFGFLAFLLGHGKPASRQTAFAVTAALIAVLVAFSRIYLGVHWLSDVIASFGLGLAWIALLGIAYTEHVREGTIRATPMILIVCITLLLVGGAYASMHHERDVARYATTTTVRTLPIGEWRDGGWQSLPAARTEMAGGPEEPFSVQWAATRDTISDTLAKAGWARPAPWTSSATLLWLLPSTPIAALPVLPRFDQGQPPALTRIRPIDARTRLVMRLWRVAEAADDTSPALRVPIWTGMITREHSRPEWHVIAATRSDAEAPPAAHVLRDAIAGQRNAVETLPASGEPVLLVW